MEASPDPLNETSGSFVVNEVKNVRFIVDKVKFIGNGLKFIGNKVKFIGKGVKFIGKEVMLLVCNNFNQLES